MSLQEVKERKKAAVDVSDDEQLLEKLLKSLDMGVNRKRLVQKAMPVEEELIRKSDESIAKYGTRPWSDLKATLDERWPG